MDQIEVTYQDSKEVLVIKRVANKDFKDLRTLQHLVIKDWMLKDAKVGELLCDDSCLVNLQNLADMLPVVGKSGRAKKLEVDKLSFSDIKRVFYTTTEPDENGDYPEDGNSWEPGLIAKLHELAYTSALKKIWEEILEEVMEKTEQTNQELPAEMQT